MFLCIQQTFVGDEDCVTSPQSVCVIGYLFHCKRRISDGLFIPGGAKNCEITLNYATFLSSQQQFVTIPCEVIITNVDILKCFPIKRAFRRSWSSLTFFTTSRFSTAIYGNFNVFLDLYPIDLNNQWQNTTEFSHTHKKTQARKV